MSDVFKTFISGNQGSIFVGNYELCADYWEWEAKASATALPTVASRLFVDTLSGHKTAMIKAHGSVSVEDNPFIQNLKINKYKDVRLTVKTSVVAIMPNAFIAQWIYKDTIPGRAEWVLVAISNYSFQDFSGTDA